jgi:uncharacterized protein YjbI with pentapeptide repeats
VRNEEHIAILARGVDAWNQARFKQWEARIRGERPGGADLSEPQLAGVNLSGQHLAGVNLRGADLRAASFDVADLTGADLTAANLSDAKLARANLREADLSAAILTAAVLAGADLTAAMMGRTTLAEIDLSAVKGLGSVRHSLPSSVGIDTIYKSKGSIPEDFLRGAGVPEPFIVQTKALVGAMQPIQFYSCFISYCTKDQDFAERLYADLQARYVRCWFAPHELRGGRKLHEQIDKAICSYEKLLLILSPDSINSEWVRVEISKARAREKRENRRMLFPVRLVDFATLRNWQCWHADLLDMAEEIRQYYIPDFSSWKTDHDRYRQEFEKLMPSLAPPEPLPARS